MDAEAGRRRPCAHGRTDADAATQAGREAEGAEDGAESDTERVSERVSEWMAVAALGADMAVGRRRRGLPDAGAGTVDHPERVAEHHAAGDPVAVAATAVTSST